MEPHAPHAFRAGPSESGVSAFAALQLCAPTIPMTSPGTVKRHILNISFHYQALLFSRLQTSRLHVGAALAMRKENPEQHGLAAPYWSKP